MELPTSTIEKPPIEKPPIEKPPIEKPPIEKPPIEKPPIEKPPIEKPPIEKPPIEKPPIERPHNPFNGRDSVGNGSYPRPPLNQGRNLVRPGGTRPRRFSPTIGTGPNRSTFNIATSSEKRVCVIRQDDQGKESILMPGEKVPEIVSWLIRNYGLVRVKERTKGVFLVILSENDEKMEFKHPQGSIRTQTTELGLAQKNLKQYLTATNPNSIGIPITQPVRPATSPVRPKWTQPSP